MPDSFLSRIYPGRQNLLFILLVLALGYLGYFFFIRPVRKELDRLQTERQALVQQVRESEERKRRLSEFQEEIQQQERKLSQLRGMLARRNEAAALMGRMKDMASQAHLKIKKFVPQRPVLKEFYEDWPIVLDMEGNYDSLGLFFERVSRSKQLININNISVAALPEAQTTGKTLSTTCTATIFVLVEPQQAVLGREGAEPDRPGI